MTGIQNKKKFNIKISMEVLALDDRKIWGFIQGRAFYLKRKAKAKL